jgi:hypothetical protein
VRPAAADARWLQRRWRSHPVHLRRAANAVDGKAAAAAAVELTHRENPMAYKAP